MRAKRKHQQKLNAGVRHAILGHCIGCLTNQAAIRNPQPGIIFCIAYHILRCWHLFRHPSHLLNSNRWATESNGWANQRLNPWSYFGLCIEPQQTLGLKRHLTQNGNQAMKRLRGKIWPAGQSCPWKHVHSQPSFNLSAKSQTKSLSRIAINGMSLLWRHRSQRVRCWCCSRTRQQ